MSYHFVNVVFTVARVWFAFPTSKRVLRYLNSPLRDLHRFFLSEPNQVNELMDGLCRMPHRKPLLLAIWHNTVLLFFKPNQSRFCLSKGIQIVVSKHVSHFSLALTDLSTYFLNVLSRLFIKVFHTSVLVPLPLVAFYQLGSPKSLSKNFSFFYPCLC